MAFMLEEISSMHQLKGSIPMLPSGIGVLPATMAKSRPEICSERKWNSMPFRSSGLSSSKTASDSVVKYSYLGPKHNP